jgi:pimeloyl-ACP methyl ester carboxylesterase/DNA-binding CsgD family transcriptional regulator
VKNDYQDAAAIAQEKAIIEETYAATMEPERMQAFETYWEAYIDTRLASKQAGAVDLRNSPIGAHIDRAMDIIERMDAIQSTENSAQSIVDSNYGFGFLINRSGKIVASNSDAMERTHGADTLADLGLDAQGYTQISAWIAGDAKTRRFLFTHVYFGDNANKTCLFVTPVDLPSGTQNTVETFYLITSVDFEISDAALDAIREAYGLTSAEANVAMRLAKGQTPANIAADRKSSIHTVRTQIKNILSKTDARGIPDMVRTLSVMSSKFFAVESQLTRAESSSSNKPLARSGFMSLPDGRILSYIEQGHPNGIPVINIHSAVSGAHITPASAQYAVLHGMRIISPYRPGYGDSDHNFKPDIRTTCDAFADDLLQLVEHLKLKQPVIVGKPYAQRFAAKYPDKVRALICLNYVPLWNDSQLDHMSNRYRTMIKTSMYSPGIVKYPARLSKILIDTGRGRKFLEGFNSGGQSASQKKKKSEQIDHILYSLKEQMKQGVEAFTHDVASIHTDWSEDAKKLKVPVTVICGDPNPYQPRYAFERYAELVPHAKMVWLDRSAKHVGFKAVIDEIKLLEPLN